MVNVSNYNYLVMTKFGTIRLSHETGLVSCLQRGSTLRHSDSESLVLFTQLEAHGMTSNGNTKSKLRTLPSSLRRLVLGVLFLTLCLMEFKIPKCCSAFYSFLQMIMPQFSSSPYQSIFSNNYSMFSSSIM